MKDKKRVIRNRIYKCQACGFEQEQETNHTGNTYSWGRYSTCPKCPPFRKYPEYGGSTVWEYVREIPEHKTCVPEVPAAHDRAREILHAKAHPKPRPKTYRLAIREEISGFIDVEAESQEEAEDIARELMDTHGVDTLFYPPKESQYTHDDDLTKYNGDHTHRNAEVLECVERTNSGE